MCTVEMNDKREACEGKRAIDDGQQKHHRMEICLWCSTCTKQTKCDICSMVNQLNNSWVACIQMCSRDHRSNVYLRARIMNYWSNHTMDKTNGVCMSTSWD